MKQRNGLVSNSSSCSFVISNISDKTLTIVDFVKENPQLVEQFVNRYDWYKKNPNFNQKGMIKNAEGRLKQQWNEKGEYIFKPHSSKTMIFGDEQGDTIGHVFDYILREGGKSEHFKWKFKKFLR